MESYDKALSIVPGYADALWNKSLLLLLTGHFADGWPLYEWRWKRTGAPLERARAEPLWRQNENIAGKRILLCAEQGFGDTIQFSRYATLVSAEAARVVLEVPRALMGILGRLEAVAHVIESGTSSAGCDLRAPLMSLPLLFKTSLATIPAAVPYLRANRQHIDRWSAKLGMRSRLRVGLAWSGGPLLDNDRNRSIPFGRLLPLLNRPVDWICLQKDIRDHERADVDKHTVLRQFADAIVDFDDTAALIELCDLVISVDTAVAHLAGALAKPVWLLLPAVPDWRWLLDREDSPWYPTAKLFRQQVIGDWSHPIERACHELDSRLGAALPRP